MKLKQIIEDQINIILAEVETIEDTNSRVKRRLELAELLSNGLSIDSIKTESKKGMESINKETIKEVQEVVQEEEITSDDVDNKLEEVQKSYIATTEEGEDVDVSEEVKLLSTIAEEDKAQQALLIKQYELQGVYGDLDVLTETYNKFLLAYYLKELGEEGLNAWIASFTNEVCADLKEFINDSNVDALVEFIQNNG